MPDKEGVKQSYGLKDGLSPVPIRQPLCGIPGSRDLYNPGLDMKNSDRDQGIGGPSKPDKPPSGPPQEKSSFPWKVAGGGALALLLVWFVLQNSHSVKVNFLWWSGAYPMILLMAAVAVAAILVWEALAVIRRRRRRPANDR